MIRVTATAKHKEVGLEYLPKSSKDFPPLSSPSNNINYKYIYIYISNVSTLLRWAERGVWKATFDECYASNMTRVMLNVIFPSK